MTKSTQLWKKPTHINNQSWQIISNFKSDPESIKIPNSESKLASILKSDPEPMIVSQIINTKILSLNMSKLKQFLSLKDEQLNKSSQWKKKKTPWKISQNKKSSQWESPKMWTIKTISKINHLSLKDEQTTSQSKLIPDPESAIKD